MPRGLREVRRFRGNPVLDAGGMEVTFWDWEDSDLRSLNLFADGTLGTSYLLVRPPSYGAGRPLLPKTKARSHTRSATDSITLSADASTTTPPTESPPRSLRIEQAWSTQARE
jgi:hypothetical protein